MQTASRVNRVAILCAETDETLRDYIQRWITLHHTVENVSDHQAVCAFKEGVKYRELEVRSDRRYVPESDDGDRHQVCQW